MIRIEQKYERLIDEILTEQNKKEREEYVSSGRLSASMLGSPLQWQVLHHYRIPPREIDPYTLRKFKRGKDIEDWFTKLIKPESQQVKAEYRGCIGYIDAMVDTISNDYDLGVIPHEIKSVTNAKFKRIISQTGADHGHILQACYYAMATNRKEFAIVYIASDDLRTKTYIYQTEEFRQTVDDIITRYDKQIESGIVPIFEPVEKWQESIKYNNYPDWLALTQEEINLKIMPYQLGQ